MALSTPDKIVLFEILETPYFGKLDQPLGDFNLSSITHEPVNEDEKLQLKILSRLAELTSDEETYLEQQIADYKTVGNNTAFLDNGSAGGINGASWNPLDARLQIQRRVRNFISIASMISELQIGKEGEEGGMTICGMR